MYKGSSFVALVAAMSLGSIACSVDPDGPALVGSAPDASVTGGDVGCAKDLKPLDPAMLPACCAMGGTGAAHCVPSDGVDPSLSRQLATCTGGFCVPDPIVKDPKYVPPTCKSLNGAPGACVSTCVPQVQQYLSILPQDTCAKDERCAPCINPLDKSNTGACDVGKNVGSCNAPPDGGGGETGSACPYTGPPLLDPNMFPACAPACGGSHCVPADLVPKAQQSQLTKCPSTGGAAGLCAPDSLTVTGGNGLPPTCVSIGGAEGRCLSTCIPLVAGKAAVLPKSTCADTERCAPCFDPSAADPTAPTGACSIACDKPTKPPLVLACPYTGAPLVDANVFPACSPACGGAHCVPKDLVPASSASQLATCPGGYCAPDKIVQDLNHYVPPSCPPFDDPASEGRCMSTCLPAVEKQASQLRKATCGTDELCAPCNDPFTGASTGACSLACDKPAKPAFKFPLCCDYMGGTQGTCVPKSNIPSAQQGNLKQDVCPTNAASYLCVPNEYLPGSSVPVATCTAGVLGKGTCVSKCANNPVGVVLSQGTCPANHNCVPCSVAPAGTPGC